MEMMLKAPTANIQSPEKANKEKWRRMERRGLTTDEHETNTDDSHETGDWRLEGGALS